MQDVFLEVLQQRAAVAVDDALGHARRARGIHDEQGVVERHRSERQFIIRYPEFVKCNVRYIEFRIVVCAEERNNDRHLDRGNTFDYSGNNGDRINALAVVEITVTCEQHFGFDLSETIDDAVDAEVRRTRRPGCTETGRRQHCDDGFGTIRQKGRDAIAWRYAGPAQTRGDTGNLFAQFVETQLPPRAVLAIKSDRGAITIVA